MSTKCRQNVDTVDIYRSSLPVPHYVNTATRVNKSAHSNLGSRVAALSDTYAVKSPLVTMARPKFAPKSTSFRGPIAKPHHLPHPWTRPTCDAKRLPDPIRRFYTMHGQTDRPTDRSFTGKFDDLYRPLRSESDAA